MSVSQAPQGAQSILRAIHLLKAFTPERPIQSLAELADGLGLNKATAHRILAALESEELLARTSEQHYCLGPAMIVFGRQALQHRDLRAEIRPVLEVIATVTRETATLDILMDGEILVFDGVLGKHRVAASLDLGTRWPLHLCATGKAFLAHLPRSQWDLYLKEPLPAYTAATITAMNRLEEEVTQVNKEGYAISYEELEPGFVAVSALIVNAFGVVEGALSVGGPVNRFSPEFAARLGRYLAEITTALGKGFDRDIKGISFS